jgi:hypothetical protein
VSTPVPISADTAQVGTLYNERINNHVTCHVLYIIVCNLPSAGYINCIKELFANVHLFLNSAWTPTVWYMKSTHSIKKEALE